MKTPKETADELAARAEATLLKGAGKMFHMEVFNAVVDLFDKQETISREQLAAELEARAKAALETGEPSGVYKAESCFAGARAVPRGLA